MDSGARTNMKIRRKAVWGSGICFALLVLMALTAAGCGEMTRQGTSPAYLIITRLEARVRRRTGGIRRQSAFRRRTPSSTTCRPIFNDVGRVSLILAMRDPGSSTQPTEPTSANFITVQRYRVRFVRADGRNTPGVDVPYRFDGAMTMTVREGEVTGSFELVRHIAKQEAPLQALVENGVNHHDHRRGHVLRLRSDRPRGERDRTDAGRLRQFRGSGIWQRRTGRFGELSI